jgi:hypothetical protein
VRVTTGLLGSVEAHPTNETLQFQVIFLEIIDSMNGSSLPEPGVQPLPPLGGLLYAA